MKRYLLTATSFTGTAILIYNDEGILCLLDLTQATLPGKQLAWFFRNIPTHYNGNPEKDEPGLKQFLDNRQGVTLTEEHLEIDFEMFWVKYAVKHNKKRCESLWKKLGSNKQQAAYYGVANYDRFLAKEKWRNKADPETYLRNEMWENEWK